MSITRRPKHFLHSSRFLSVLLFVLMVIQYKVWAIGALKSGIALVLVSRCHGVSHLGRHATVWSSTNLHCQVGLSLLWRRRLKHTQQSIFVIVCISWSLRRILGYLIPLRRIGKIFKPLSLILWCLVLLFFFLFLFWFFDLFLCRSGLIWRLLRGCVHWLIYTKGCEFLWIWCLRFLFGCHTGCHLESRLRCRLLSWIRLCRRSRIRCLLL